MNVQIDVTNVDIVGDFAIVVAPSASPAIRKKALPPLITPAIGSPSSGAMEKAGCSGATWTPTHPTAITGTLT